MAQPHDASSTPPAAPSTPPAAPASPRQVASPPSDEGSGVELIEARLVPIQQATDLGT